MPFGLLVCIFLLPALKKWGLYWIHPVRHSFFLLFCLLFCDSVIIQFLLNILRRNRHIETKFCIHIIIDKINFGLSIVILRKFATELWPLIDIRIYFLFNILRKNRLIETKFCIHIIIDKIYVGIVNRHFSQICNCVTDLN